MSRVRGIQVGSVEAIFLFGGEDNSPIAFPDYESRYCARYGADLAAIEIMQPIDSSKLMGSLAVRDAAIARVYERIPTARVIEADRQRVADYINNQLRA